MLTGRATRRADDAGAVAVEAALLVPMFLLIILAIMEFSLMMRDTLSVTESARVGVRIASALPRQLDFTRTTVEAIGRAGTAMPKESIREVLIYKANAQGYPGPDGSTTMSCAGLEFSCDRYTWDGASGAFALASGGPWNPQSGEGTPGHVNACPGDLGPPDSVGVYIAAEHDWVTGLFGVGRVISDRAVLPFEPLQPAVCR
jgi:TadE-like protein